MGLQKFLAPVLSWECNWISLSFYIALSILNLQGQFISLFLLIFISDQDSVRLLAVEGCGALGKLLEPQDCVAHILPVIVNFSQVILFIDGNIFSLIRFLFYILSKHGINQFLFEMYDFLKRKQWKRLLEVLCKFKFKSIT